MTLQKLENETYLDFKYRVLVDKVNGDIDANWDDIEKALHIGMAKDSIRKGSIFLPEFKEYLINKFANNEDLPKYKENIELKADGSTTSDKLITIAKSQDITKEFLLDAHGFDKTQFELVSAKNSIWNVSAGKDPNKTLYSSRISVKPKESGFDIESLVEATKRAVNPSTLKSKVKYGNGLLTIPFVDLHFGINTYEDYNDKLLETLEIIESKEWDTIYIPFGHDLLHNNDHKGKTANGTQIEKVDMDKAWEDAVKFYKTIIDKAIVNSNKVVADYVCGNHDADLTWGFAKLLKELYPNVKFDTSISNKKYFKWEDVLLVSLHGDKGINRVVKTLMTKYRDLVVNSNVVEVYSGHVHHERVKDEYGVVVRTLPTSAKEDEWHVEQSFEGSVKYSQVFEYKKGRLKTIHHV